MKYLIILSLFFLAACQTENQADLILYNGQVVTLDPSNPGTQAVAKKENKIMAVGSDSEILQLAGTSTEKIDLIGKMVSPGLIDAHVHILGIGKFLKNIDLTSAKSWDEIVGMVENAAKNAGPGEWILGRGWHQEKWITLPEKTVQGYPVHKKLSEISPENPVILDHASGHAVFANALAMRQAGITKDTPDPNGGIIVRDASGAATGVFLETAESLIDSLYEKYLDSMGEKAKQNLKQEYLELAMQHCLENGITSVYNAGSSLDEIDMFRSMADKNELKTRLWIMISGSEKLTDQVLQSYKMINYANGFLNVSAIKQYADGALGARGAWMLEPYSDMPGTSGLNTTPLSEIEYSAELAARNNYQLCTHAIGDRANREVLNIYEHALNEYPDKKERRWRIEHAQHIDPDDLNRFVSDGVIASFQTVHCTSDGPWVPDRIGQKRSEQGAYIWQKILKSGGHIANGTDAPVESLNPIENYYAAITRKMNNGKVFYPGQVLSREEALKSLTIDNAYAAFQENNLGSVSIGKWADLTVLSQNLLTTPENEILNTEVEMTIVNGKILYRK